MDEALAIRRLLEQPILLLPNRVQRPYIGGRMLAELAGIEHPEDGHYPEDWVGSATRSAGYREESSEGLSRVTLPGGSWMYLADIITSFPEEALGTEHVAQFGSNPAVLVKLIDARDRLPVHYHPNRTFAQRHLDSPYGKTEAWIILHTRTGKASSVWIGMRASAEEFYQAFKQQDSSAMLACLNQLPAAPGDVFFIPGGVPHAIGPGMLLAELQEPTDFSIRLEYQGLPISPETAHLGLGWDLAFEGINEMVMQPDEARAPYKVAGHEEGKAALLGGPIAQFFRAYELEVPGCQFVPDSFAIDIVISGTGFMIAGSAEVPLSTGSAFFIPSAAQDYYYRADRTSLLRIIRCMPPIQAENRPRWK